MLTAITRAVSPAIVHCELSFIDRQPIDLATAQEQHHAYEQLLGKLGARVISLPPEPTLPDSMFVEDPAIVLDVLAVILPLGTETRRREAQSLAQPLSRFRKLEYVSLPGTLEGGDVLRCVRPTKSFLPMRRTSPPSKARIRISSRNPRRRRCPSHREKTLCRPHAAQQRRRLPPACRHSCAVQLRSNRRSRHRVPSSEIGGHASRPQQIGRASCRERVWILVYVG